MAETAQEITVTNEGQPQVVQITAASESTVAREMTPQLAANVTVTITPASG